MRLHLLPTAFPAFPDRPLAHHLLLHQWVTPLPAARTLLAAALLAAAALLLGQVLLRELLPCVQQQQ
jgi:hypothetical protein